MIAVSLVVFVGVIRIVLRHRTSEFSFARVLLLGVVVVVGGMFYGSHGARYDWPWWVFLSAPLIHVAFALFLGWDEYMPFLPVPSLAEILA